MHRPVSEDELEAVRWTMDQVFQCQMSLAWPMQFLLHPFWFLPGNSAFAGYRGCISSVSNKSSEKVSLRGCLKLLKGTCRGRFDSASQKLINCKAVMWNKGQFTRSMDAESLEQSDSQFTNQQVKNLTDYFKCLNRAESPIRTCAKKWLDNPCQKSSIRIIKTVRATMAAPRTFLHTYPNFRLLHLFRDPRGVTKSRLNISWAKSAFEGKNISRVAKSYCQNVLSDYRIRQKLEGSYPGQILQVLSDDFMVHSLDHVERIMALIGTHTNDTKLLLSKKLNRTGIKTEDTQVHRNWVESAEDDGAGGIEAADSVISGSSRRLLAAAEPRKRKRTQLLGEPRLSGWHNDLTWQQVKDVESTCAEFYKHIPYNWQF